MQNGIAWYSAQALKFGHESREPFSHLKTRYMTACERETNISRLKRGHAHIGSEEIQMKKSLAMMRKETLMNRWERKAKRDIYREIRERRLA